MKITKNIFFNVAFLFWLVPANAQVRVWISKGLIGHSWITVGDSVAYSFGNYLHVHNNNVSPRAFFRDAGVIVKSRWCGGSKDSKSFIVEVDPIAVKLKCDSIMGHYSEMPRKGIYANSSARVAMEYKPLKYNCVAFTCDMVGIDRCVLPSNLRRKLEGKYVISFKKILAWSLLGLSGSVWGAREAYHADSRVFERTLGVGKYSFLGSHAWERNYVGNRFINESGAPNKHKTEIFANFGRDFWHTSGYASGAFMATGAIILGKSKTVKKWQKALDFAIGAVFWTLSSNITYNFLMN